MDSALISLASALNLIVLVHRLRRWLVHGLAGEPLEE